MQASAQQIIFYVFATLSVLSALLVITQNNPVRCVLFLVATFFACSVLWILVHAEFLALVLVLVYVGAVMTLFLFVVMMLNIDIESMKTKTWRYMPLGLILIAFLVGLMCMALTPQDFQTIAQVAHKIPTTLSDTEALGMVLYTDYVWAFELAAVILLVAIVASITLVHRRPIRSKQQNIVQQLMTRSEDRLTLHAMKAEK